MNRSSGGLLKVAGAMAGRLLDTLKPTTARVDDVVIPAKRLRQCSVDFQNDRFFLASARAEADRLTTWFGIDGSSRILDLGCGSGRLAIGIAASGKAFGGYVGVDVNRRAIEWCRRNVESKNGKFRFEALDVQNDRYNPAGKPIDDDYELSLESSQFDVIYSYSLFSHLTAQHTRIYLRELARLLSDGGGVFLTAFVADEGADCAINPEAGGRLWSGPLHCVLFRFDYFESMILDAGLEIRHIDRGTETDGQSAFYLRRKGS